MQLNIINSKLLEGDLNIPEMFPHLALLKESPYVFKINFGLNELPAEPGILLIRGARQYGKSTWLEQEIYNTIKKFGAGTAFYLNGEYLLEADKLELAIQDLLPLFPKNALVKRIFIDEITAIPNWEIALKRLADSGKLSKILIITTGSKATDLRRGAEKLPGRKGKLPRTTFLFSPISYKEFHRVCGKKLGQKTLLSYLISGGSPIACSELAAHGIIPEYVIELIHDWIEGEIVRSGRSRVALSNTINSILHFGSTPVGQAKLARESGLANNTVAAGYIELLNDLGCICPAYPWDQHKNILILRKPCKYHITNLLLAITWHKSRIRRPEEFLQLPEQTQGIWYEWLVSQEFQRREAMLQNKILMPQAFWQNKEHEIDFIENGKTFIEVKRGKCSPLEFSWFARQFPKKTLIVINEKPFQTDNIRGITLEDFLLENIWTTTRVTPTD